MASRVLKRVSKVLRNAPSKRLKTSLNNEDIRSANKVAEVKESKTTKCSTSVDTDDSVSETASKIVKRQFFQQTCADLAQALLGKTLVRKLDSGQLLRGIIVETEAYLGEEDKGAHSYKLKKTDRNKAMFMEPGTIYVYHIYGMYTCMNISSEGRLQIKSTALQQYLIIASLHNRKAKKTLCIVYF